MIQIILNYKKEMKMERVIYILIISLLLFSCNDDKSYPEGDYLSLSTTKASFDHNSGENTIGILKALGATSAKVISEDSEWCTVSSSESSLVIKVEENTFPKVRTAVIEVTSGEQKINVMVRQGISPLFGKTAAFRFEREIEMQWIPYYLRTTDTHTIKLRVGSVDFNENEEIEIEFEIDEEALATYNEKNEQEFELLPTNAFVLPENFTFAGTDTYQDLDITIDLSVLNDQSLYGLPLKIKSTSSGSISDILPSVIVTFCIEDLAGWYTVDRLEKCGEGEGKYPEEIEKRRRKIVRTGDTTWETGYLFGAYSDDDNHTGSGNKVQYITINPVTKEIHIQQNGYDTSDDRNVFDITKNELHLEYLYAAWEGWWTHERMYNRSLTRE